MYYGRFIWDRVDYDVELTTTKLEESLRVLIRGVFYQRQVLKIPSKWSD